MGKFKQDLIEAKTLNQTLADLGYTTKDAYKVAGQGSRGKTIFKDGAVIMTGTASEVWAWLHSTGQG